MYKIIRMITIITTLVYLHPFWRMYFDNIDKNKKNLENK